MITASQIWLLAICVGQAILPHYSRSSAVAREGTRLHKELIPAIVAGELPDTPRGRQLETVEFDRPLRTECTMTVSVTAPRARVLGYNLDRDYSDVGPDEIPGTADLVAEGYTGELKTGSYWVESPPNNPQMLFAGLAQWLISGDVPTMHLVQATGRGRVRDQRYEPQAKELIAYWGRIKALYGRVAQAQETYERGERLPLVTGPHCRMCDAIASCPAATEAFATPPGSVLTDEDAAREYQRAAAALAQATEQRNRARAAMLGDVIEVDGQLLVREKGWRRVVDSDRALAYIEANYGTGAVRAVDQRTTTVGRLDTWAESQPWGGRRRDRRARLTAELEQVDALEWRATENWKVS